MSPASKKGLKMTSGRFSIIVTSAGGGTGDPWAGGVAGAGRGAGLALCGRPGRWAPRCPAGAGVSTAHGRPAEAGARRARAAKSPSGVRGRGWTRVGRCAWTGAFEDVLLPRFSRGASGVTDARGSCSGLRPDARRRPAEPRGRARVRPRACPRRSSRHGRQGLGAGGRPGGSAVLSPFPRGRPGRADRLGKQEPGAEGGDPGPQGARAGDPRGGLEAARVRKRRREQATAQGRAPDARGAPETFARLRFGES